MTDPIRIAHGETVDLFGQRVKVSIENSRQGDGPVQRVAVLELVEAVPTPRPAPTPTPVPQPAPVPVAPDTTPPPSDAGSFNVQTV